MVLRESQLIRVKIIDNIERVCNYWPAQGHWGDSSFSRDPSWEHDATTVDFDQSIVTYEFNIPNALNHL